MPSRVPFSAPCSADRQGRPIKQSDKRVKRCNFGGTTAVGLPTGKAVNAFFTGDTLVGQVWDRTEMDRLTSQAAQLAERLKHQSDTIAVAESSAGGLISAALLAVPGASAYFLGGGVIYTRAARRGLLDMPEEVITMRAATEEYALIVARGIRERLQATWGFCETGASGPTGNRYGDAPGHSCFAMAGPRERSMTLETGLSDREENMWRFAEESLAFMESVLR